VPVGKLHSERCIPVDADARATFTHMLELRAALPQAQTSPYLLPRPKIPRRLVHDTPSRPATCRPTGRLFPTADASPASSHLCHFHDPCGFTTPHAHAFTRPP
jgi:hypothetical protein